ARDRGHRVAGLEVRDVGRRAGGLAAGGGRRRARRQLGYRRDPGAAARRRGRGIVHVGATARSRRRRRALGAHGAVSMALGERLLALTGAGLLAGVIAVAVAQQNESSARASGPQPAVGQGVGWSSAVAGVARRYPAAGKRSRCGWLLRSTTLGVV